MLLVFQRLLITERLSARLLILQSVFSVDGVWPQLPSYGVACMETSVLLRNAIKISCLQKLCMLMSLSLSAVVLAVSLSRQNGKKNCDASKEELRDWRKMKAKTERVNAATTL